MDQFGFGFLLWVCFILSFPLFIITCCEDVKAHEPQKIEEYYEVVDEFSVPIPLVIKMYKTSKRRLKEENKRLIRRIKKNNKTLEKLEEGMLE